MSAIQITLEIKHHTALQRHPISKGFLFEVELKFARNHILSILGTQKLPSQKAVPALQSRKRQNFVKEKATKILYFRYFKC